MSDGRRGSLPPTVVKEARSSATGKNKRCFFIFWKKQCEKYGKGAAKFVMYTHKHTIFLLF
jgi:hypothetical protein